MEEKSPQGKKCLWILSSFSLSHSWKVLEEKQNWLRALEWNTFLELFLYVHSYERRYTSEAISLMSNTRIYSWIGRLIDWSPVFQTNLSERCLMWDTSFIEILHVEVSMSFTELTCNKHFRHFNKSCRDPFVYLYSLWSIWFFLSQITNWTRQLVKWLRFGIPKRHNVNCSEYI